MSEQLPLSERTLQLADRVVEREASVEQLALMTRQLIEGAQAGRAQFLSDSDGNPEITEDEKTVILASMDAYVAALAAVLEQAEGGQVENLGAPLAEARQALAAVREHQTHYQQACIYGPAMHPFLNRLLAHLDGLAARPTEKRHTLALLESLPAFLEEVGEQVGGIDEPTLLERSQGGLRAIEGACGELRAALESGSFPGDRAEFMGRLRQAVLEGSDLVSEGLGAQFENDLSVGRTPYPPVNLVLAACDRLITGHIRHEHFKEVVGQAVWLLGQRFPEEAQDSVAEASREVRESLERLYALPPHPDPDEVVSEREMLRSATENLSMFVAVLQSEEEVFDLVQGEGLGAGGGSSRGLPLMLSSLLQLGDQFLEGQATAQEMADGIAMLEQTVTRSRSQVATARDSAERGELLQAALAHLESALAALRELTDQKGGRGALERAENEMQASQEAMRNLESRR